MVQVVLGPVTYPDFPTSKPTDSRIFISYEASIRVDCAIYNIAWGSIAEQFNTLSHPLVQTLRTHFVP